MGEPCTADEKDRLPAEILARALLADIRNDEPIRDLTDHQKWLLAATVVYLNERVRELEIKVPF
jgi:hypothetical protein